MLSIILVFLLLMVLLLLYMWKSAVENIVVEQRLSFHNFPESFGEVKIFFISDIHKRKVDDSIIDKVKGNTDIVIIGGDLMEKGVSFSRVEDNVRKLKKLGPVYFVWGNNDYEVDYHELDALLLSLGVKILDNTAVLFQSEAGDKLSLMGVDYIEWGRADLDQALADSEEDSFKVLISHCPRIMNRVKKEHHISLVLSGHTHGGQIRLFGIGKYSLGGISKKGNTLVLTSNGYGTSLMPLRLGARSETHLIYLSHGEKNKVLSERNL